MRFYKMGDPDWIRLAVFLLRYIPTRYNLAADYQPFPLNQFVCIDVEMWDNLK
jgi:hypothetical protein